MTIPDLEQHLDTFLHPVKDARASAICNYPLTLRESEVGRADHGIITIGDAVYFRSASYCQDVSKRILTVHNELVRYDAQTQKTEPVLSKSWTGPLNILYPEQKSPFEGSRRLHDSVKAIGFYQSILPLTDRYVACIDVDYKESILAGEWHEIDGGSTSSMHSLSWPTRAFLAIYDLNTGSRRAINLTDCIQEELTPRVSSVFMFQGGTLKSVGPRIGKDELVVRIPPSLFSYNPVENKFTLLHRDSGCFQSNVIKQELILDSSEKGYLHRHSTLRTNEEQDAARSALKLPPHLFAEYFGHARGYSEYFPLPVQGSSEGILRVLEDRREGLSIINFSLDIPHPSETMTYKLGTLTSPYYDVASFSSVGDLKRFSMPWDGLKVESSSVAFIPGTKSLLMGIQNRIYRVDLEKDQEDNVVKIR